MCAEKLGTGAVKQSDKAQAKWKGDSDCLISVKEAQWREKNNLS